MALPTLDAAGRRRFARHLLLVDVGEEGQRKLCNARVDLSAVAPAPRALASRYLERAGVRVEGGADQDGLDTEHEGVAGERACIDAICGAWIAVEELKRILELGVAANAPDPSALGGPPP